MRKLTVHLTLGILLVLALWGGYYYYTEYQKVIKDPSIVVKQKNQQLIDKVGKFVVLPTGEEPTVATVTDYKKLKDQAFFGLVENGDQLILYTKAKKAILYRPSTNKVINVAPINIGDTTGAQVKTIKVTLYNGTFDEDKMNTFETQLKEKITNAEVVSKSAAGKRDYAQTLVIDLTGNLGNEAQQLSQFLGGKVGTLPSGEKKPTNSDLLVIIGGK